MKANRWLVPAALLMGATFASSPSALGHSDYDRSSPAHDEIVDAVPAEVWTEYTEPPGPDAEMKVYDACGRQADDGDVRVFGFRVTVGMTGDAPGRYIVRWRATSLQDGHPNPGWWSFTVRGTPSCGPGSSGGGGSPAPSPEPTKTAAAKPKPRASKTVSASPTATATRPVATRSSSPTARPEPTPVAAPRRRPPPPSGRGGAVALIVVGIVALGAAPFAMRVSERP